MKIIPICPTIGTNSNAISDEVSLEFVPVPGRDNLQGHVRYFKTVVVPWSARRTVGPQGAVGPTDGRLGPQGRGGRRAALGSAAKYESRGNAVFSLKCANS